MFKVRISQENDRKWVGRSLPRGVEFQLEDNVLESDKNGFMVMSIQPLNHSNHEE
jgi:hypothetical protein